MIAESAGAWYRAGPQGLRRGRVDVALELPRAVALRDERSGRELGTGTRFILPLVLDEALVVSWPN
jgi:hypothetical protein